ncbi:S8 family serine peptidase [Paenibacillus silvae]|uniref:S8 family serine peptidase n=1 Tax=Paenibacillus silvae TaxID=1325358 RepID=UPI002004C257|nr:S8 family serine peptidase [Paenibacillus silvae]MCK6075400.1 S8 family serine peptidase [Paenibacillus silvae]MCK6149787.1 S8 family serine peptidase [Paenibacillus silvae]MCK6268085.1 S8 family serine peptidase [Paenibacillus silvae]
MKIPDPTWARLGFLEPPNFDTSGQDVGIIIIDRLKPHPALRHLGHRLKYITVQSDLSVHCNEEVAYQAYADSFLEGQDEGAGMHGLQTVLALSHEPFAINGDIHIGLCPAAHMIVLDHGAFREGEGERLKAGVDWILEQKAWNCKIILSTGWHASEDIVLLRNSQEHSTVRALQSAVQKGVLVVCANGNTRLGNVMPPIDYFAVGGYDDCGTRDRYVHIPFPDEPFGRNGDGHFRPDILAPRLHLTLPFCESVTCEEGQVSYYGGTSGAATLIAGAATYLFSKYPGLNKEHLCSTLLRHADPFVDYENNAPRVNVGRAIRSLEFEGQPEQRILWKSSVKSDAVKPSIRSSDEVERGLALSRLVEQEQINREELWRYSRDTSSIVRKIAVHALMKPKDAEERALYWEQLRMEHEGGVRGWYAYGLLQDANETEVHLWIPWSIDINWAVRWCVSEYVSKYKELFPQLEKTDAPRLIQVKARDVLRWLELQK